MNLRLFFVIKFLIISFCLVGQSPYKLSFKKEPILLGIGLSLEGVDQFQQKNNIETLSIAEVMSLDRMSVNSFDRGATFNSSKSAKQLSDVLFLGSFSAPFLFLGGKETRQEWGKIGLIYIETALITTGLTGLTKRLSKRIRPLAYNDDFELSERQRKQNRFSFFSGHTSLAASNSFFIAKVFSDYYPDSKWKPYIWGAAIAIPAATAVARVQAGKHYRTDVITGFVVGGAIGFLIPHLHRSKKKKDWSLTPTMNGFYFRSSLNTTKAKKVNYLLLN